MPPIFTIPVMVLVKAVKEKSVTLELPRRLLLILIATPVAPAFEIATKAPDETTEKP